MRNEQITVNVPNADLLIGEHISKGSGKALLCDTHYHDEIELLSITEGSLVILLSGEKVHCQKGDVVFCSSRIPHATYLDGDCRYTLVQFRPERYLGDSNNIGKYFNRFLRNAEIPFAVLKNAALDREIDKALSEYREGKNAYEMAIKGSLYTIIALLCREGVLSTQNSAYSADIDKIRSAIAYIEENSSREITLSEIAAIENLNPSYFCRLFKKASGAGFIDYLNFVRICKSEKLLARGTASILDIAYDVGFSSVSYFNRIFKRYKNCTPTEYRRAHYEKQ